MVRPLAEYRLGTSLWLIAGDGGIFGFGDRGFDAFPGDTRPSQPKLGVVVAPGP
jgi:hypothetical protein